MADSDIPAEACGFCAVVRDEQPHLDSHIRADERARVLAEHIAALWDEERYRNWWVNHPESVGGRRVRDIIAAYLRDEFGAEVFDDSTDS